MSDQEKAMRLEEMQSNIISHWVQQNHTGCFTSSNYNRMDNMGEKSEPANKTYVIPAAKNYTLH